MVRAIDEEKRHGLSSTPALHERAAACFFGGAGLWWFHDFGHPIATGEIILSYFL